jgi:hypothetical protein
MTGGPAPTGARTEGDAMRIGQIVRPSSREDGWLERAIVAGFVATALMTTVFAIAYGVAILLGSADPGAPLIARWLWGLGHNVVTAHARTAVPAVVLLHFVFGLVWAVIYAALAEPRLTGPAWRRGALFALLPGLLSLLVFLPAVGGGILGLGLGAGPLPIVGNLLLHLVYGTTLGRLYPAEGSRLLIERGEGESPDEARILAHAEQVMALGLTAGLALGALLGWLGLTAVAPDQPALAALAMGAVGGSAVGALVGSFAGLSPGRR